MTYRADVIFKYKDDVYGAIVDVDWEWVDDSIENRSDGEMCPYLEKVIKVVDDCGHPVKYHLGMEEAIQAELETLEPPESDFREPDLEDVMS